MKLSRLDQIALVLGRFAPNATMPPVREQVADYDWRYMPVMTRNGGAATARYVWNDYGDGRDVCPQASQLTMVIMVLVAGLCGFVPFIFLGICFVDRLNAIHQRYLAEGPVVKPVPFMEIAKALAASDWSGTVEVN